MVQFKDQWVYKNPKTGFYYSSGIIPGFLFFSKFHGNITLEDIDGALPILEDIYRAGKFDSSNFIRVVDYKDVEGASFAARKAYAQALNYLNKKFNCIPKVTFICRASLYVRTTLQLFAAFVNQKLVFCKSVEEAFSKISNEEQFPFQKNDSTFLVSSEDILELNEMCGNMLWNESEQTSGPSIISDSNPLYPLKEALRIVMNDIVEIRKNDRENLQNISVILESVQAGIVIVDRETHKIIYANPIAENMAGASPKEMIGKTCHAYICPNKAGMCPITNMGKSVDKRECSLLRIDGSSTPVLKSVIPIKYRGHSALLETFTDISYIRKAQSELEISQEALKWRISFQQLITQISSEFAGVVGEAIDRVIYNALMSIGKFINADHAFIFRNEHNNATLTKNYEWFSKDCNFKKETLLDSVYFQKCQWFSQQISQKKATFIPDTSLLSSDTLSIKTYFLNHSIKSSILIALMINDSIVGFMGFDSSTIQQSWTYEKMMLLQVFSETLSSVLERNIAENQLRHQQQQLTNVIDATNVGTWEWNVQTDETVYNEKWASLIGYSLDELKSVPFKLWEDLIHPEDKKVINTLLEDHFSGGQDFFNCECRMRHKNGHWIWLHERGRLITRTADGKPLLMYGTHADITARKQVESALKKSRTFLEDIFQSIQDGLSVINKDLTIRHVNSVMTNWFKEKLPIIGGKCHECFHHSANPCSPCPTLRCFISGKTEVDIIKGPEHSKIKWLEIYSYPLKNQETGEIEGAIEFTRDITDRKRAEEQLLQTNRLLEDETARANTMAAQAEMANAAKSDFLANMSHEIRTPMNGIIGMTALLMESNLTDEQRQFCNVIQSSGESLLSILNDILDISKIEAGKLLIEPVNFDLYTILKNSSEIVGVKAQEKGLELICHVFPDVPALLCGDIGRIRQVLINLAGNAVKFTHRGEISISISVVSQTETDVILRISVRDTGIGIPKNKLNVLFSKFTQADNSTTRKYGGTGLGLAISKQLAQMMGGEIGVISPASPIIDNKEDTDSTQSDSNLISSSCTKGVGSEFWFTLSLKKQATQNPLLSFPEELQGNRILIVDDNSANREMLQTILNFWGMAADTAPNYEDALNQFRQAATQSKPFHFLLIDYHMPSTNGEILGRAIKIEKSPITPVLLLMIDIRDRNETNRFKKAGFSAFLQKPVLQQELFTTIVNSSKKQNFQKPANTSSMLAESNNNNNVSVLLAEDNKTNQLVALNFLKKLGIIADVANNGLEAISLLEKKQYNLVFMDVQMPEMDGLEATRHIRDRKSKVLNHDIIIIAMTAHTMRGDQEKCIEAGMNDYIAKPIIPGVFTEKTKKWLTTSVEESPMKPVEQNSNNSEIEPSKSFDKNSFLARVGNDLESASLIIATFFEDIQQLLQQLSNSIEAGNIKDAKEFAHTIKGVCANVNAETMRSIAFNLENACIEKNNELISTLMHSLETEHLNVQKIMQL